MKKLQSGGVFDINPQIPQIGRIGPSGRLVPPQVSPAPVGDLMALNRSIDQRRRDEEQRLLREQQLRTQQDRIYADLSDKIFLDFHNPNQQRRLDAIKKRHGVGDSINMDVNDIFQSKEETRKLISVAQDPEFTKLMGEIEYAKMLRDKAASPSAFRTPEDADRWVQQWEQYQLYDGSEPFQVSKLAPTLYDQPAPPKKTNPRNLFPTTIQTLKNFSRPVDPNDPADLEQYYRIIGANWYSTDPTNAETSGLFEPGDGAVPVLSAEGKQIALDQLIGFQGNTIATEQSKDQRSIDVAKAKAVNQRQINPPKTSSKSGNIDQFGWTEEELERYETVKAEVIRKDPQAVNIDWDDENVRNIFEADVKGEGISIPSEDKIESAKQYIDKIKVIEALEKNTMDVLSKIPKMSSTVVPPATIPPAPTTTVTPVKKWNPVTKSFE